MGEVWGTNLVISWRFFYKGFRISLKKTCFTISSLGDFFSYFKFFYYKAKFLCYMEKLIFEFGSHFYRYYNNTKLC